MYSGFTRFSPNDFHYLLSLVKDDRQCSFERIRIFFQCHTNKIHHSRKYAMIMSDRHTTR